MQLLLKVAGKCCKICISFLNNENSYYCPRGTRQCCSAGVAKLWRKVQQTQLECCNQNRKRHEKEAMIQKVMVKRSGLRPAPSCLVTGGRSCVRTPKWADDRDDRALCTARYVPLPHSSTCDWWKAVLWPILCAGDTFLCLLVAAVKLLCGVCLHSHEWLHHRSIQSIHSAAVKPETQEAKQHNSTPHPHPAHKNPAHLHTQTGRPKPA